MSPSEPQGLGNPAQRERLIGHEALMTQLSSYAYSVRFTIHTIFGDTLIVSVFFFNFFLRIDVARAIFILCKERRCRIYSLLDDRVSLVFKQRFHCQPYSLIHYKLSVLAVR